MCVHVHEKSAYCKYSRGASMCKHNLLSICQHNPPANDDRSFIVLTETKFICCRALRDCPRGQLLQSPTRWFGNRRRRAARVCRGGVRAPGLPVYTRHFNLMLARRRFSPNFRLGCGGGKNQQEFANSFHPYFTLKAKSGHIGLGCSKTAEIILFSTYL
jgi:hypothetical protein